MVAVLQRVSQAAVWIAGNEKAAIGAGLVILLGIEDADGREDIEWICRKAIQMRIFADSEGVMNNSILDSEGEVLLISQFTLHASTKKGNRPSYIKAAKPDIAVPLYETCIREMTKQLGKSIETGVFGANMQVSLVNDGPVTIILDSKNKV
ncbi:D-aminoacyl-tRNA deacylase [Cyclobacterium jeungdonense]|uniref:D-aminoacyl-tRNA deacylase n=1 Tax=Cyclobacterium jeungdonense TaxID=708087 RepID=A0ABT8C238_9BACT|nr:D-aminoacyl-tRNA deacylase [Cyclobacterium jeungdonense]MDN3686844.1 D-aminoacyl-tRNA deacylase [Cyclobacterium jeungdonense]